MRRLTAVVQGRVQGVGFRAYTQQEAVRLNLAGWVANRWDGSVKVVAEGPDINLERLVRWLQHGPPSAHVTDVGTTWDEATGEFRGFQIRH
jgi:acylphosphatase